jgi:hypothetical protein
VRLSAALSGKRRTTGRLLASSVKSVGALRKRSLSIGQSCRQKKAFCLHDLSSVEKNHKDMFSSVPKIVKRAKGLLISTVYQ